MLGGMVNFALLNARRRLAQRELVRLAPLGVPVAAGGE